MGVNSLIQIGTYLKKIRLDNNLTQEQFAKKLNITRTAYANYEKNLREPSKKILDSISNTFGVNLMELIALENSNTNKLVPSKDVNDKFGDFLNEILRDRVAIDKHLYHSSTSTYEYLLNHCFSFINDFIDYKNIGSSEKDSSDSSEKDKSDLFKNTISNDDICNIFINEKLRKNNY